MIYGERIRQVREMHRMTQADLAKEIPSLTQSRLSRIEKDLAHIDAESLALIASFTGVSVEFFERPPVGHLSILSPQMRARSRLTQGEKSAALQWARLVDEEYENLRRGARRLPVRMKRLHDTAPEGAAIETRRLLGFEPDEPLPYLLLAVERIGVRLLGLPYSVQTLDAFCAWRHEEPIIAVLSGLPADRVRFSVAHELGHLVLHKAGQTGRDVEAEADQFAAELLTPLAAMRKAIPSRPTLSAFVMLKTQWGVSVKSLIRRAREIEVIGGDRALSLYKQISARGWNKNEPGYVSPEKPRALRKMAELVYGAGISTARMARGAAWSEHLVLDVLAHHAGPSELPYEPRHDGARSRTDDVVPFRPRHVGHPRDDQPPNEPRTLRLVT